MRFANAWVAIAVMASVSACESWTSPLFCKADRIAIDTTKAIVAEGRTRQLSAVVLNGRDTVDAHLTWGAAVNSVVMVGRSGEVSGLQAGQRKVTAEACGRSASVTVLVVRRYHARMAGGSENSSIVAVSDSGDVVTRTGETSQLWRDGNSVPLTDCFATDLDNRRRVSCRMLSAKAPAVWENGVLTRLLADTAYQGTALGISDSGFVVLRASRSGPAAESLFVWRVGHGVQKALPVHASFVPAPGVSNTGVVAWFEGGGNRLYPRAYVWANGQPLDVTYNRQSFPSRVNGAGFVIGSRETFPPPGGEGALWSPPGYTSLGLRDVTPVDVDGQGHVIGTRNGPVLVIEGRILPLADVLPAGAALASVAAMSDAGLIAGIGAVAGSPSGIILLVPRT